MKQNMMFSTFFNLLFLCSLFFLGCSAQQLLVNTTLGPVEGIVTTATQNAGVQVRFWNNIFYAKSTAGALRWTSPVPRTPWTTPVQANPSVIIGCPQTDQGPTNIQEDCLVLNIVAPLTVTTPLPVLVYIHGGSLRSGAGGLFDGTPYVAEQNIVFVSINYRLGFLGFLGLPQFESEASNTYGNWGFLDQRLALTWIQDNIAAFGGDPNQVTINGQSAGALSVIGHLTSPLSASPKLFSQAIVQSYYDPNGWWTRSESAYLGQQLAFSTGYCANVASGGGLAMVNCLRGLDFKLLIDNPVTASLFTFALTIDNKIFTGRGADVVATGSWARVPIYMGINHDEYAYWLCSAFGSTYSSVSASTLGLALGFRLSNTSLISLAYGTNYPPPAYPTPSAFRATVDLVSDFVFDCSLRNFLDAAALDTANPNANKIFAYQMNYVGGWNGQCNLACHGIAEIPLLYPFAYNPLGTTYTYTQSEIQMAKTLRSLWGAFVKNGDPSITAQTVTPYCAAGSTSSTCLRSYLQINGLPTTQNGLVVASQFRQTQCAFWNSQAAYANSALDHPGIKTHLIRITGFPSTYCAASPVFSASIANSTCSGISISGTTYYVIPQCSIDDTFSPWSAQFYSDSACTVPLSTPLSAPNSQTCGGGNLVPGIGFLSVVLDCINNPPIFGTITQYSSSAPNCGASNPSFQPADQAIPSGACAPAGTASLKVQCFGSTANSPYTVTLYQQSNCAGSPAPGFPFTAYSSSTCIPVVNSKLNCGSGGSTQTYPSTLPPVVPTTVVPAGSTTFVTFTFKNPITGSAALLALAYPIKVVLRLNNVNSIYLATPTDPAALATVLTFGIKTSIQNDGPQTSASAKSILLFEGSVSNSQLNSMLGSSLGTTNSIVSISDPNPPTQPPSNISSNYWVVPVVVIGVLTVTIVVAAIIYVSCCRKSDGDTN